MKKIHEVVIALMLVVLGFSCSSGSDPTQLSQPADTHPANTPGNETISSSETPLYSPYSVFGAWKVQINPDTLEYDMIPSRSAKAIGDTFDADLSQFLTVSPCSTCLQITNLSVSYFIQNYKMMNIDLQMKHPFSNLNKRPDLHGFDVRAIFIGNVQTISFDQIEVLKLDNTTEPATITQTLLNADGYTSHYDDLVTDPRYFADGVDCPGNLNPFLRFFESYTAGTFDPFAPSGQNVMAVGSAPYKRTAKIPVGNNSMLEFYIVADVAYGHSAIFSTRQSPQYYLPAFHRTEPWRVEYWIENNNLADNDPTSSADVMVQVFDWQHGATVDPGYPNPSNLTGIKESSNVKELILSIPDLQNTTETVNSPESGSGSVSDPLTYRVSIKNELGYDQGWAAGFLAVRDELYGKAAPSGRFPIPSSPSGFPYDTKDILDYSIYVPIMINIPNQGGTVQYKNELFIDTEDQYDSGTGTSIECMFFMDMFACKFQYRWDYDYDGSTFDVDGAGMPSERITFATPGLHNVGLRIRTNSVPPREYIYTIPVYKQGTLFTKTLDDTGADMTSATLNQSVDFLHGVIYVVFNAKRYGKMHSFIASIDGSGNIRSIDACGSGNPNLESYHPAIEIKRTIWDDEIYVAYTGVDSVTGETNIYLTITNPDLTVFTMGLPVSEIAGPAEMDPKLILMGTDLYCYYTYKDLALYRIYVTKSTDGGYNWTAPQPLYPNSNLQKFPSVAYNSLEDCVAIVYQDEANLSTAGADLMMAFSEFGNGLDVTDVINISSLHGPINETKPALTYYDGKYYCSYLARPEGSQFSQAHVKVIDLAANAFEDIPIILPMNKTHTGANVIPLTSDQMLAAYGEYNTSSKDLTLRIYEIDRNSYGYWDMYVIEGQTAPDIEPEDALMYPAMLIYPTTFESVSKLYYFYTDFTWGVTQDDFPIQLPFGDVKMKCTYLEDKN